MKDLRELSRALNSRLLDHRRLVEGGYPVPTDRISIIEAFAREIRNEAISEVYAEWQRYIPISSIEERQYFRRILLGMQEPNALAASESEK